MDSIHLLEDVVVDLSNESMLTLSPGHAFSIEQRGGPRGRGGRGRHQASDLARLLGGRLQPGLYFCFRFRVTSANTVNRRRENIFALF